jgi:hypothetical protein
MLTLKHLSGDGFHCSGQILEKASGVTRCSITATIIKNTGHVVRALAESATVHSLYCATLLVSASFSHSFPTLLGICENLLKSGLWNGF